MPASRAMLLGAVVLSLVVGGFAFGQAPDEATKVYAILLGDTNDPNIGESVGKDLENMEKTLQAGFEKHKNKLEITVLKGPQFTLADFFNTLKNLKLTSSDTLYVYFACHGGYAPGGGHYIAMDRPQGKNSNILIRSDLRQTLLEKGVRLVVLISDTCNSFPPGFETKGLGTPPDWETIRCLFLLPRGLVDINSVSEGESAYGNGDGGFFSSTLVDALRMDFKTLDTNKDGFIHWEELVPRLQGASQLKFDKMRNRMLDEVWTDKHINDLPELEKAKALQNRAHLKKQTGHSVRVYSLPPLARFGVRVVDNGGGGAKVLVVQEFTPAALAGFKPGDVIKKIGSATIKDAADFLKAVETSKGETVVEYQRGDTLEKTPVKIASWPVPGREG